MSMNTLAQFVSPDTLDTLANTRHPQKQRREGKLIQCSVIITVNSQQHCIILSLHHDSDIIISLSINVMHWQMWHSPLREHKLKNLPSCHLKVHLRLFPLVVNRYLLQFIICPCSMVICISFYNLLSLSGSVCNINFHPSTINEET